MSSEARTPSRNLILKAAAEVFASHGIKGATTREIAKVAGVNETTLFRNFQTKEVLLKAVVESMVSEMTSALYESHLWTQELRHDLLQYATVYNHILEENEPMVRMFIGEAQRQPDEAKQVIQCLGRPLREKLATYFRNAMDNGKIRPELSIEQVVDAFTGMIMAGLLRRGMVKVDYSTPDYLACCVDLFLKGVEPAPSPA